MIRGNILLINLLLGILNGQLSFNMLFRAVGAVHALQVRLDLLDWTGDPCLPAPFDWLGCNDDVFPRVTSL